MLNTFKSDSRFCLSGWVEVPHSTRIVSHLVNNKDMTSHRNDKGFYWPSHFGKGCYATLCGFFSFHFLGGPVPNRKRTTNQMNKWNISIQGIDSILIWIKSKGKNPAPICAFVILRPVNLTKANIMKWHKTIIIFIELNEWIWSEKCLKCKLKLCIWVAMRLWCVCQMSDLSPCQFYLYRVIFCSKGILTDSEVWMETENIEL